MSEPREVRGRKPAQTAMALEPFSVSPREACRLLSIGTTRLYELLADGELQSYVEGNRARRILLQSIRAYIDRRVAHAAAQSTLKPKDGAEISANAASGGKRRRIGASRLADAQVR